MHFWISPNMTRNKVSCVATDSMYLSTGDKLYFRMQPDGLDNYQLALEPQKWGSFFK